MHLSENEISDISALSGLTSLTTLHLNNNQISDISALSGLTSLTTLYLGSNKITTVPNLSGLTQIKRWDFSVNRITSISRSNLPSEATDLTLRANQIVSITAADLPPMLKLLVLSDNKLREIPDLSGLTALNRLALDRNPISKIEPTRLPSSLTELDLTGHRIYDPTEFLKLVRSGRLSSLVYVWIARDVTFNGLDILKAAMQSGDTSGLNEYLWMRPDAIDSEDAVTSGNYPEDPPIETFPFTINFAEPVTGFEMDDITIETELHTGTGTATLEALTPTTGPAQTYIATIRLPTDAAGTVRVIVRAGAAETGDGRIDPAEDRAFPWIAFTTIPVPPQTEPPKRKIIIYQCPVGWQRTDGFARKIPRVIIYEVNLGMDMSNRVSIYKPTSIAIYVHPDEGLENLEGWKLQVAIPYNHHREYLLTAENSIIVDSKIEGVEGGFAFIANPEENPFPMVGMGFTGALVPGFDYRLYDDTGRKIDFGIACYKRGDIFQVLKNMEEPRVLRKVLLESFDWDSHYLRSEWTVPVPVNAPGAPSLQGVNVVGKWADLKEQ